LAPEEIRCAGPLHYDIDVGVSDGGLWANGSLSQPVELRCVSCLQKFVHEIRVPAFAVHTELHGPETIDLTPFVREDLLLNLPAHPHCDRDGDRVCRARQVTTKEPVGGVGSSHASSSEAATNFALQSIVLARKVSP
jgi:uncharacterized protein